MNKIKVFLLLITCSFLYPALAAAVDYSEMSIEELLQVEITLDDAFDIFDALFEKKQVSVATGKKQDTTRAPAVTSVITAMDIEAMGATDLDEVLETIPGFHIGRSMNWYAPIYTIRGSSSSQGMLLLFNGMPIKELWSGDVISVWTGMPVNNIARIEVMRGPGSAVFGADAFTGVVNVMTKTQKDINGTEVGIRRGSFNTLDTWALHGGTYNKLDIALAAEYQETDGPKEIIESDVQTLFDRQFGTHASLAPASVDLQKRSLDTHVDLTYDKWQFRAGYQGRYDVGSGAGPVGALDYEGRYYDERVITDLLYRNPTFSPVWNMTARVNFLRTKWYNENTHQYPPGAFGGLYPYGQQTDVSMAEQHTRFSVTGFYSGLEKHLLRLETGYHVGDLYEVKTLSNYDPITLQPFPELVSYTDTPFATVMENARQNGYISVQDIWTFSSHWELTTGLRYDYYSDFAATFNPRLALVWIPRPHLTAKLLYGRAFLAPTASQQYVYVPNFMQGNPDLDPETIDTIEFAFDYRPLENLNLALNLFSYRINDKILFTSINGIHTSQNSADWKGSGLEFETRWKITPRLSLIGNYSYQQALDADGNDLADAPQQQGFLRSDWMIIPNWYLDTRAKWVANRVRMIGDDRPPVEDYILTDLTLRYKDVRQGRWNIALGIRNAFDVDAREPSFHGVYNDLPLAGQHYFLELRYTYQ